MSKDIIHHRTLAGGVAGSRATEFIIAVLTLHHEGTTTAVCHADEQVTLRLVGLRERHAVGLAEGLQQVGAGHILKAKALARPAMNKTSGVDVTSKKSGKRLAYLQNSGKLVVWLHNERFVVVFTRLLYCKSTIYAITDPNSVFVF